MLDKICLKHIHSIIFFLKRDFFQLKYLSYFGENFGTNDHPYENNFLIIE